MPTFEVDDKLHSHPKAAKAGDDALGMWVRVGSWCACHGTDGIVDPNSASLFGPKRKWQRLIDAGFVEKMSDGGYKLHDFLHWNKPAAYFAELKARKAANKRDQRVRLREESHARPKDNQQLAPNVSGDNMVTSPVTRQRHAGDRPVTSPVTRQDVSGDTPVTRTRAISPSPSPSPEEKEKNIRVREDVRGLRLPPDDFMPNRSDYGVGQEENMTSEQVDSLVPQFLDTNRSSGKASADWHAEFRRYIRNRKLYQQPKAPSRANGSGQQQATAQASPASHKYIKPPEPLTPEQCRESAKAAKEILDTMFADEEAPHA